MSNGRRFRRPRRAAPDRQPTGVSGLPGPTVIYLGPDVDETMPPHVREGLVRRRLVAKHGECPCGAVLRLPSVPTGGEIHVTVEHETDCPAAADNLEPAMQAWRNGRVEP